MNNQAAQTMPTLPRPYWKAGDVKDDYGNPYNETDLFTDDDMRAMYQQGYAAALSQTAGVADGFVLVPREPSEAMLDAMHERIRILCDPARRTADIQNDREVWAAMLSAASGEKGVG